MPTFDIEAARKDGLPDNQILQYLGKAKGFDVDSALKNGADQNQLLNYLSVNDNPVRSPKRTGATGTWEPTLEGRLREKYPKSMAVAQGVSDLARPVIYDYAKDLDKGDISTAMRSALETSGGVGGTMLRSPLGIPGYMAGKRVADIFDVGVMGKSYEDLPKSPVADALLARTPTIDEGILQYHPQNMLMQYLKKPPVRGTIPGEFSQTARDAIDAFLMQTGFEASKAGYQSIAPAVKKTYGFVKSHIPWKSKEAINRIAAKELKPIIEGIEGEDKYSKTFKESMALKKEIPNAEYTLGQASGEPNAIMMERRLARGEIGANAEKAELQKLKTGLAGREYIQQYFPEGEENIDDVIKGVREKKNLLKNRAESANKKFAEDITAATPSGDLSKTYYNKGQAIFDRAKEIKGSKYLQAKDLYDKIPNIDLNTEELLDDAIKLKQKFIADGHNPADFPESVYNNLLNRISEVYPDGTRVAKKIPFQELRGIRSNVKSVLRTVSSSETPNAVTKHYLREMTNDHGTGIIEKALAKMGAAEPGAAQAWKEADKFYKTDYIPSVRQRTVNSILTPGGGGTPTKFDYSAIPDKFTKNVDTAKDYTRIFGKGDKEIQDVMMAEMLNKSQNSTTKQINREIASRWYNNNRGVLEELGIQKPFQNIIRSQASLESAAQNLDGFNQSILSKVLEADPQHAIGKAFSGNTKNTAHVMRSMLNSLPSPTSPDKHLAAIGQASRKGLKRAFVDYIFDASQKELASDVAEEVGKSPIVNISKRGSLLKQYSGAMQVLFRDEPQKLAALKNFQLNSEIITRNIKSPIGGGSDTKELLAKDVSRIAGVGLQGFGTKIKILKIFSRYYGDKVESQVNQVLERALYDPDEAFRLVREFAKTERPDQRIYNVLYKR